MAENFSNYSKFEDTIQCSFFSISQVTLDLCDKLNKTIAALSEDYMWHRDQFKLCVSGVDNITKDNPAHLTSTTCFGDNIEDEWFIVYLVMQITRQYSDLIVQVADNDGDFLLIEAADHLPTWANPETTENRVFIYRSQVHLIPPEVIPLNSKLELKDAINLIKEKPEETKATTEIQEAVIKRINSYPQKIKECNHRALVTLPIDIATLLTLKPSLISPIVTTYCNHDMLDEKCLKNIKFDHCVTIPVLFTKYLYAMIMHSKLSKTSKAPKQSKKEESIGFKLACGYEILMSKSSDDIFSSDGYNNFMNSLIKNGYFKDNIEGSKEYQDLLQKAKDYFSDMECPFTSYCCYNITELMKTEDFKIVRDLLQTKDTSNLSQVDTDEWLDINPDELNTFLNTHYGKKLVKSNVSTIPQITSELANYLKKTSDFEGIEHIKKEESNQNQIEFDSDQFMSSIEKMLNLVSVGKCDTDGCDSDFSEEDTAESVLKEEDIDRELESKLQNADVYDSKDEHIITNLLHSIKEEGLTGPSSNVLRNIELSKTEFLDSDDD